MLRDRLHVSPDVLRIELAGGGGTLDLAETGLRVLRQRLPIADERSRDELVLVCADGTGVPVTLFVRSGSEDLVQATVESRPLPDSPRPARLLTDAPLTLRGVGPVVVLGLGVVAGLLTALALVTAIPVRTTVLSLDRDDRCRVTWTDPRDGVRHDSIVDCVEDPGQRTTIYSLAGPLRGAALDSDTPWIWSTASGGLVIGGAFWTWRTRRRRSVRTTGSAFGQARGMHVETARSDPLRRADLVWSRLSELSRSRAAEEGWGPESTVPGPPSATAPRWKAVQELGSRGFVVMILPAVAIGVGWTAYAGVLAGFGPVTRTEAAITGAPEGFIPVITADELPVRFTTASGRRVVTRVAVHGLPDPAPATLPIEYSVDYPERVRALEHAGHVRGATTSSAVVLLDLGFAAAFLVRGLRRRRAESRARASGETHQVQYALFLDPFGSLLMAVFTGDRPDGRPAWLLPLDARARHVAPPTGRGTLHGRLADDAAVAASLEGHPVRADGPLLYAHADVVLDLLNARTPDDD